MAVDGFLVEHVEYSSILLPALDQRKVCGNGNYIEPWGGGGGGGGYDTWLTLDTVMRIRFRDRSIDRNPAHTKDIFISLVPKILHTSSDQRGGGGGGGGNRGNWNWNRKEWFGPEMDSTTRFSTSSFFSWISFPQAPEYTTRAVSNYFENSRRYLQLKVHHRCPWHRGKWKKSLENFNDFVWTPLGSNDNIYMNFCLQVHFKMSAAWYCSHYLPPVSLTPVANLPPVSLIRVAICHPRRWHQWQICHGYQQR